MREFSKKLLALLAVIAVTASFFALPVSAMDAVEAGQPAGEMTIDGTIVDRTFVATPGVTDGGLELTIEAKDPFDLQGMERVSSLSQKNYNASGYTGADAHLYGNQLPANSAAKMVYDAIKADWLGKNPALISPSVTIDLAAAGKSIPMRTTQYGVYNNINYWDAQSILNFDLATQCAIDAFLYDFPDVFWMKFGTGGLGFGASLQGTGDGYGFNILSIEITPAVIDNASQQYTDVDNKVAQLYAQFNSGTNVDKLRNAHDYIAQNIAYDFTSMFGDPHTRTPYGTLFGDYIVCEGYARTFKLFCDRFNIPSVLVMGYGVASDGSSELHMWNSVKVDGKWYLVDVTWDDLDGVGGIQVWDKYFLVGLDTVINFAPFVNPSTTPRADHIPMGVINSSAFTFAYPSVESLSYFDQIPQPPAIEVTPPTVSGAITYGDALSGLTLTGGSYTVNGSPVTGTLSWDNPSAIPASGDSVVGYRFVSDSGSVYSGTITVTVAKRLLTIVPNNVSVTVGSTMPAFTFNYVGLVNGDSSSVVNPQPVATSSIDTSAAGTGTITITNSPSAVNYDIALQTGIITVYVYTPGGSSSGGGGGGGGSTYTGVVEYTPIDVTVEAASAAAKEAASAAKKAGKSVATMKLRDPGNISLKALKDLSKTAGMPVRLIADSMSQDGRHVEVRLGLDPSQAKAGLNLSASCSNDRARRMRSNFEKWFKNKTQPVCLGQRTPFGQTVEFVVKLDPGMKTTDLKFYSYNGTTYTLMPNQSYTVDKNGYVRFYGDPGGDIIISDGPLVKKK